MPPATGYASASTQTAPASGLSEFSLLVDLSELPADWWNAITDADFTKGQVWTGDGATRLPVDWIDPVDNADGTGSGFARIKYTPTLTGTGQTVRIYPPDSGNSAEAAGGTFGQHAAYDASWWGYWPLFSDANDRTSNARNLTNNGSMTFGGLTGKAGPATAFNSGQWLSHANQPPLTGLTAACLYAPDTFSTDHRMMSVWGSTSSVRSWAMWIDVDGGGDGLALALEPDGGANIEIFGDDDNNTPTAFQYYHCTDRFAQGGACSTRVDGVQGEASSAPSTIETSAGDFEIGRLNGSTPDYADGGMQHAQIHSTVRADAWVDHEYEQSDDNAAFWGAWGWTAGGGGGLAPAIAAHHYRQLRN